MLWWSVLLFSPYFQTHTFLALLSILPLFFPVICTLPPKSHICVSLWIFAKLRQAILFKHF